MSIAHKFVSCPVIRTILFNIFTSSTPEEFAYCEYCWFNAENSPGYCMDMQKIKWTCMCSLPHFANSFHVLIKFFACSFSLSIHFCTKQLANPTRSGNMDDMLRNGKYGYLRFGHMEMLCKQLFTLGCHLHMAIVELAR